MYPQETWAIMSSAQWTGEQTVKAGEQKERRVDVQRENVRLHAGRESSCRYRS